MPSFWIKYFTFDQEEYRANIAHFWRFTSAIASSIIDIYYQTRGALSCTASCVDLTTDVLVIPPCLLAGWGVLPGEDT